MQVEWLFGGYNVSMGENYINPPTTTTNTCICRQKTTCCFFGVAMKASGHLQENKKIEKCLVLL